MLFRVFGNYLRDKGLLTQSQLDEVFMYRKMNRVKLGGLAVEQGLMTAAQAEEVNRLQATQDKRFGEIAIEKNYLTEVDMDLLIKKQGNPFYLFLQAVQEKNFMTRKAVIDALAGYQKDEGLTDAELELLKSSTAEAVAEVFLHTANPQVENILKLAVRNLVRFITTDLAIGRIENVREYSAGQMAAQFISGTIPMMFGFTSDDSELLEIARIYGKEEFTALDADAFDAVCEFINCNNGLYARAHSTLCCELELKPPTFAKEVRFTGELYLLPLLVNGKKITAFVQLR